MNVMYVCNMYVYTYPLTYFTFQVSNTGNLMGKKQDSEGIMMLTL